MSGPLPFPVEPLVGTGGGGGPLSNVGSGGGGGGGADEEEVAGGLFEDVWPDWTS